MKTCSIIILSFLLSVSLAQAEQGTGYKDCDITIQKAAAAAFDLNEKSYQTISITKSTVTRKSGSKSGQGLYIQAQFKSVELAAGGTAIVITSRKGCILQSLIIENIK